MVRRTTMQERRISALNLAAYLMARDYAVVRIEGGQRKAFVFADVPEGAIVAYYAGTDQTSARKLFGALRDLKALAVQPI
jgi:hypothetical protein